MKLKTVIMLLVIFCILLTIVLLRTYQKTTTEQQAVMGRKLFDHLAAADITAITLTSPEGAVSLKQNENLWTVSNRYNYPADFAKISDLVKKLAAAKIGRTFKASAEIKARLALYPPDRSDIPADQKGARIVLTDRQTKPLADIIIGKQRLDGAGMTTDTYYAIRPTAPEVYLLDQNFRFLDKKPSAWLQQNPLDLNPKDIEKVVCLDPQKNTVIYTLKRPAKEKDPVYMNLPAGKKLAKFKADQVFEVLTAFTIEDVADPAKASQAAFFSNTSRFDFYLFNGTIYHVHLGAALPNGSENHYFKATVSYHAAAAKNDPVQQTDPDKLAAAAQQNNKPSPWTYIISKWVFNSFIANPDDLFEKAEKK